MKRLKAFYVIAVGLIFQFAPLVARASSGEGLDVPEALNHKVPLEGLAGLSLLFSKLYNENLWLFAIVCTVLMAVVGMAIALVTDVILKAMGMETEKLVHRE